MSEPHYKHESMIFCKTWRICAYMSVYIYIGDQNMASIFAAQMCVYMYICGTDMAYMYMYMYIYSDAISQNKGTCTCTYIFIYTHMCAANIYALFFVYL